MLKNNYISPIFVGGGTSLQVFQRLNYGRRTLSTRESVLFSEKKRGERYLAFTGVDVL